MCLVWRPAFDRGGRQGTCVCVGGCGNREGTAGLRVVLVARSVAEGGAAYRVLSNSSLTGQVWLWLRQADRRPLRGAKACTLARIVMLGGRRCHARSGLGVHPGPYR